MRRLGPLALLVLAGCGGSDSGGGGSAKPADQFVSLGCASCHTLKAANSHGTRGPNLDEAKPSVEVAIDRITNGEGVMPSFKSRLSAAQIKALAEYVSSSAGS